MYRPLSNRSLMRIETFYILLTIEVLINRILNFFLYLPGLFSLDYILCVTQLSPSVFTHV